MTVGIGEESVKEGLTVFWILFMLTLRCWLADLPVSIAFRVNHVVQGSRPVRGNLRSKAFRSLSIDSGGASACTKEKISHTNKVTCHFKLLIGLSNYRVMILKNHGTVSWVKNGAWINKGKTGKQEPQKKLHWTNSLRKKQQLKLPKFE